jgi:DNA-directed RNA polymerase subunit RPC12/RpoP
MSRIEFVEGIQCNKCGNILIESDLNIFTPELCQKCGTKLISTSRTNRTYRCEDSKSVIVKVTHKFFTDTYEVVRENND